MVLPSAPAGAGHVFCVSRRTDRDCCGNGGGARVKNDHFLPNHHGSFSQNDHFRLSTVVEMAKMSIFDRQPRWKCSKRPFSVKNRGGNAQNAHFLAKNRGGNAQNGHFPQKTVVFTLKTVIFPSPTMVLCFKMTIFTVATSVLPLKTFMPPANLSLSYAECAMGIQIGCRAIADAGQDAEGVSAQ